MFKSIQIRMFLILILLAIIMFVLNSYFIINNIQIMDEYYSYQEIYGVIRSARIITSIMIGVFIILSIVIVFFASRTIFSPIAKLIKKAKKMAEDTEEIDGENLFSETFLDAKENAGKKSRSEIDQLVKAFEVMTNRA